MTYTEALQKMAENNGFSNFSQLLYHINRTKGERPEDYYYKKAAELWQAENVKEIEAKDKRIAELEAGLKSIKTTYSEIDKVDIILINELLK
jgi:hypothetical protein